jgi:hypothetical protein
MFHSNLDSQVLARYVFESHELDLHIFPRFHNSFTFCKHAFHIELPDLFPFLSYDHLSEEECYYLEYGNTRRTGGC